MKDLLLSIAVLTGALAPCLASATLGEPEATVQIDNQALRGSVKSQERAGYRVHEIQLASGTLLREFVGADGKVFAVAWTGPFMPNLRQTLGSYFAAYVDAAGERHAPRRRVEMKHSDLVVQSSGHMRAFSGRAYLPQSVPAGVAVGELR